MASDIAMIYIFLKKMKISLVAQVSKNFSLCLLWSPLRGSGPLRPMHSTCRVMVALAAAARDGGGSSSTIRHFIRCGQLKLKSPDSRNQRRRHVSAHSHATPPLMRLICHLTSAFRRRICSSGSYPATAERWAHRKHRSCRLSWWFSAKGPSDKNNIL